MVNLSEQADVGLNLRIQYIDEILEKRPDIGFFEVIAENLIDQQETIEKVKLIRKHYPIHLHCVGMNIAGNDALDYHYLEKIKLLIEELEPRVVSDHLCFQKNQNISHFDLLPFPLHEKNLEKCQERLSAIHTFIQRSVYVENLTSYIQFHSSTIHEADFLVKLCTEVESKVLLDLNNIDLNDLNFKSPYGSYLDKIPKDLIGQIHIAGGELLEDFWVDTHGTEPKDEIVESIVNRGYQGIPICYERDSHVPQFEESVKVIQRVKRKLNGR